MTAAKGHLGGGGGGIGGGGGEGVLCTVVRVLKHPFYSEHKDLRSLYSNQQWRPLDLQCDPEDRVVSELFRLPRWFQELSSQMIS